MPVRGSGNVVSQDTEQRKADILRRIQASKPICTAEDLEVSDDENDEKCRQESLREYKRMISQTMDLPLEKLILTPEGCDIFDKLCIRIDVNQRYADLLPQWKDVAHHLEIDSLVTKWVETCVRPREGLTRAIMEIYMKDGGTLGEVLEALLHLELLDILEETRPGLEKFIKMKVNFLLGRFFSDFHFCSSTGQRRTDSQVYDGQRELFLRNEDTFDGSRQARPVSRPLQVRQRPQNDTALDG